MNKSRNINLEHNVSDSVFKINKQMDKVVEGGVEAAKQVAAETKKRREAAEKKVKEFQSKTKARTRTTPKIKKSSDTDTITKALVASKEDCHPAMKPVFDMIDSMDLRRSIHEFRVFARPPLGLK